MTGSGYAVLWVHGVLLMCFSVIGFCIAAPIVFFGVKKGGLGLARLTFTLFLAFKMILRDTCSLNGLKEGFFDTGNIAV